MRFLKFLAIFMVVLVLAAAGLIAYFFSTSKVEIVAVDSVGRQASDRQEQFDALKNSVINSTFQGTMFSKGTLGEAGDYALITYTVRLKNQCLVPIDMIEMQIVPTAGDVLQIGDLTPKALPSQTEGNVQATLLTGRDNHSIRELIVTYYVWGVSFTLRTTSGAN